MDLIPGYINSPVPEGAVVQYRDPTASLTSWLGCWEQSGCSGTEFDSWRFDVLALSFRVWFCFESDCSSHISSFEFSVPIVMASGSWIGPWGAATATIMPIMIITASGVSQVQHKVLASSLQMDQYSDLQSQGIFISWRYFSYLFGILMWLYTFPLPLQQFVCGTRVSVWLSK